MMADKQVKRVLILEDDLHRIKSFMRGLVPHEHFVFDVDIADNVGGALEFFETTQYDLVFLDNDLCPSHYEGKETTYETGFDFVKKVVDLPQAQKVSMWVVHTLNELAAYRMLGILQKKDFHTYRCSGFTWHKDNLADVLSEFKYKLDNPDMGYAALKQLISKKTHTPTTP